MHSCVGRIRYLGVMLYDADDIHNAALELDPSIDSVNRQLNILLDPFDDEVIAAAKANGMSDSTIKAAQDSPTYRFVKEWKLALPLHPEFRTLPMLFYVPPLLPVMASLSDANNDEQAAKLDPIAKSWNDNWLYDTSTEELWGTIDQARFPLRYMANLFTAGDEDKVKGVLKKLMAVRIHRRGKTVGDIPEDRVKATLQDVGMTAEEADDIYYLTSLAKFDDRFVIPPAHREQAIEMLEFAGDTRGSVGFGFKQKPQRGL
jgi:nitrate reductase beta subunit